MSPQPKKDPSLRARTNTASTASRLVERDDGVTVIAPILPERRNSSDVVVEWHPLTVAWWADLWASPMSSEYHSSDRHGLYVLAALVDAFWTFPTTALAAEIRLQRQAFGLTPYDRRRLEWTIVTAKNAVDDRGTRKTPSVSRQPKAATDPRLALADK